MPKNITTLPIEAFRFQIMRCDAPYSIFEAETGSGKSTRIPLMLHEAGLSVLVASPTIESTIGNAEYVAQLAGCQLGTTVGYRTSENRCDSSETKILFATDGLALVRELAGHNQYDVLVIDELHQWNNNQSALEAWAWKMLQKGTPPFKKIVVLSATIDSSKLSEKRGNAPVFKVPGRTFPIVDREAGISVADDVCQLVEENFDVLVFMPGKEEIEYLIDELSRLGVDAELLPFYGKLEREEKDRAYQSYPRPKVVVSTNALETGRTLLPSQGRKLAVVDIGMERRIELVEGIESLVLAPISEAQAKQRRGRTGRVSEGLYVDHYRSSRKRPEYPVPEIVRTRLDQMVLRLAVAGFDATELPFFHEPDSTTIAEAYHSLRVLGAVGEDGQVTEVGRMMAYLPISVQTARMIVESQKFDVMNEVITIAALLEEGGINDRSSSWRELVRGETKSDLIAQLRLWHAARKMTKPQMRQNGIHVGAFYRVQNIRKKLLKLLRPLQLNEDLHISNRDDILRACIAGMVEHLFLFRYDCYKKGDGVAHVLGRDSVIRSGRCIVGMPKSIKFRRLVVMATEVDPLWLAEVAPQLYSTRMESDYRYDSKKEMVVVSKITTFNDQIISCEDVKAPVTPEATQVLIQSLVSCSTGHQAEDQNTGIQYAIFQMAQEDDRVLLCDYDWLTEHYRGLVGNATTLSEIAQVDLMIDPADFVPAERLSDLSKEEILSKEEVCEQANRLYLDVRKLRWSLPFEAELLLARVIDLYDSRPSTSIPVKMMPWMTRAQTIVVEGKEELLRRQAEEERQEQELRRREAKRLEHEAKLKELLEESWKLKNKVEGLFQSDQCEFFAPDLHERLTEINNTNLPNSLEYSLKELMDWVDYVKEVISMAEETEIPKDSGPVSENQMANLLALFGGDVRR